MAKIPEVIRTPEEELDVKIKFLEIKINYCFARYTNEFDYDHRTETDPLVKAEYLAIINSLKEGREHANQAIERLKQIKSEL